MDHNDPIHYYCIFQLAPFFPIINNKMSMLSGRSSCTVRLIYKYLSAIYSDVKGLHQKEGVWIDE